MSVGVDMRVGMGVGADVGRGAAVGLGTDAAATAVGEGSIAIGGATAILGCRTDAVGASVGDGVDCAAGALGAAQPAVIANMTAAIARAGGSAALITAGLCQLHEGCAVASELARFRFE